MKKKQVFSSKSSCDHSAPGSFPFWPFFMCGVCYPNPGAPGMFIFVSLRQCSSHLLLSASTHFIVRVLSAWIICTLPHLGIIWFSFVWFLLFFVALISAGVFFGCALVPGTLALDLPTSIFYRGLIFLCLTVCDHRICISTMKNQEGHWGYCWCRWVERTNGLMFSFLLFTLNRSFFLPNDISSTASVLPGSSS